MQDQRRAFLKSIAVGGMGFLLSCSKVGKFLQTGGVAKSAIPNSLNTDFVHFNSYGQSLSIGGTGSKPTTVSSIVQKYDSVMPNLGVRTADYAGKSKPTSFVPLVEKLSPDGTMGETLCSGCCEMFNQAINDIKTFTLHAIASGEGRQNVANLSKGSFYYKRFMNDIQTANSIAAGQGKTFSVGAIGWTQGEQDYDDGTTYDVYEAALLQLNIDTNADIRAITGQQNVIPFIVGQTSSQNRTTASMNDPVVALAQLDACINNPNFTLASPMYMLDFIGDNTHMDSTNYRILASYYGYAMKKFLMDGVKNFIYPARAHLSGNFVTITFNVPVMPLVFDTVRVADPGGFGFSAKDSAGTAITVNTVEIISGNTVKIGCANPPSSISYAINGKAKRAGRLLGPRGCLRDSQGNTIIFDPGGTNWPLHNWAPIFELTYNSGIDKGA